MLLEEAEWIGETLNRLPAQSISPCINLGASTRTLREIKQPYTVEKVLAPLSARNIKIVHSDIKSGEGIDVAGDIYDARVQMRLAAFRPRLILCTNILEHLRDPGGFARACSAILAPEGYILVSVPRSYPYHPDPIDTLFRPSPEEIATLFPGFTSISSGIVTCKTYLGEIARGRTTPAIAKRIVRDMIRTFVPFIKFRGWISQVHRYRWLFRPYEVSVVLLGRGTA